MVARQNIIDKINRKILGDDEAKRVLKVLRSGYLSKPDGGPMVLKFQKLMAIAHGKKYSFAVTSGTAALHCAIVALNLKPNDEVIVPALSNIADCSVIMQEGGTPVFVDVDPADFNIDAQKIEEKINKKTKAIIVVHMYGQPAKIKEIKKITDQYNLILIEDCAQAAGARYNGRYVGSFGDISCFSFYQTKHIICGEGGMIMTNNSKFARIITSVANNGIVKENLDAFDYDRVGYNYQMPEMEAALGIEQFYKLDRNNLKRRNNAKKFKKLLSDLDIHFQISYEFTEAAYFYLTGLLPQHLKSKREEFINIVKKFHAPIKKLYPMSLPEVTLFKNKTYYNCPAAKDITKRIFNLYVNPGLNNVDIEFMASAVRKAYGLINS